MVTVAATRFKNEWWPGHRAQLQKIVKDLDGFGQSALSVISASPVSAPPGSTCSRPDHWSRPIGSASPPRSINPWKSRLRCAWHKARRSAGNRL